MGRGEGLGRWGNFVRVGKLGCNRFKSQVKLATLARHLPVTYSARHLHCQDTFSGFWAVDGGDKIGGLNFVAQDWRDLGIRRIEAVICRN